MITRSLNLKKLVGRSLAALLFATPIGAMAVEVTLRSFDGSFDATGDLTSSEGNFYVIETDIGELKVRKEFVECIGGGCPSLSAQTVQTDQAVVLKSFDGTAEFVGDLVGFDGTTYSLDTSLGQLQIRSEFVTCDGAGCPEVAPSAETFTIALPGGTGTGLIAQALNSFAAEKSQTVTSSFNADGSSTYLVSENNGELVAEIKLIPTAATEALGMIQSRTAALAITRIPPQPNEIAGIFDVSAQQTDQVLSAQTVALDAILPLVHTDNDTLQLSFAEIAAILSGRVVNWSDISGAAGTINVYGLAPENELMRYAVREILGPLGLSVRNDVTVLPTSEALAQAVAADPFGFALAFRSESDGTTHPSVQSACGIVSGTGSFQLQSEEYPMTLRWHLNTVRSATLPRFATSFADFLLTDRGQSTAERNGLVGLDLESSPIFQQGERLISAVVASPARAANYRVLQNYLTAISKAERLSTTLRFLSGSTRLDARALQDIKRVSDLIRSRKLDGRKLTLVGFSDSVGSFNQNVRLSQVRANRAKTNLLAETVGLIEPDDIATLGFGPIAPVGCNQQASGRDMNRRVEIWLQ